MAAGSRGGGIQRVLQKLNKSIEEGHYYEAHQMIRTLYFRYTSQKKDDDALELLHNGACLFLKHKQTGSGTDLAMLMLDCIKATTQPITNDSLQKIVNVFKLFESDQAEDRHEYIHKALRITADKDPSQTFGSTDLHHMCARICWQEKNYGDSRYHFLHTHDGFQCASMLVEFATSRGFSSEQDLFVTQTVLQYLCLKNATTASIVFFKFTNQHPDFSGKGPPFQQPLLNFVWFLLLAIERHGNLSVFTVLCEKYQPSIERDPNYKQYLDRIAQLFFGLPPPQQPPGLQGLMGDLMQSLFADNSAEELEGEDVD